MFDLDAAPSPDAAALPPQTRAERRMRRLEQMADQGVEVGRLLTEQARFAAAHASSEAVPDNLPHARLLTEIASAHARVARAVAVASAIEDRIDQGLPAIPEIDHARRTREDLAAAKRERAADAVERGLDQGAQNSAMNPRRRVRLRVDLLRLLDAETADLDRFLARPLGEIVARLNRDLGLDLTKEDELWLGEDPSPVRGRMGPVLKEREDGLTDAAREPTPPPAIPSAFENVRAARIQLRASVTPSSQSPPATPSPSSAGACFAAIAKPLAIANGPPSAGRRSTPHPAPCRGRISRVHPPP